MRILRAVIVREVQDHIVPIVNEVGDGAVERLGNALVEGVISKVHLLCHSARRVLVDNGCEAIVVVPLELSDGAGSDSRTAYQVTLLVVVVVIGSIREQTVARAGQVAGAMEARADAVAVVVVGVRLVRQ